MHTYTHFGIQLSELPIGREMKGVEISNLVIIDFYDTSTVEAIKRTDIKRDRVPCSIIKLRMEFSIILKLRQSSHSVQRSALFVVARKEIFRSSIIPTIRRFKAILF